LGRISAPILLGRPLGQPCNGNRAADQFGFADRRHMPKPVAPDAVARYPKLSGNLAITAPGREFKLNPRAVTHARAYVTDERSNPSPCVSTLNLAAISRVPR
jgi:hypothetical protein